MKNLKVSMKLIISFMIVVVLAVAVGAIGMVGMNSINNADDALYKENVVAMSKMGNIRENLQNQRVHLRDMCLNAGDREKLKEYQDEISGLENKMERLFIGYEESMVKTAEESAYFEAKNLYNNEFFNTKRAVEKASFESLGAAYKEIYNLQVAEITAEMVDGFNKSMANNDQWASETVNSNTALYRLMFVIETIVLTVAVFMAIFFAFYISSLISKPLAMLSSFMKRAGKTGDITLTDTDANAINKYVRLKDEIGQTIDGAALFIKHVTTISEKLETIAAGDLTAEIVLLSDDDVMGKSMRQMVDNLNAMFSEIQISTSQVATGSKQVADGAQSLAQGATEQAASIQELLSSISEIAERTKTNAATAEMTSKLSMTIKENAEKGSHQMDDMIIAVKDINNASQSISKIIKTIDDIAFQTNILALNAAVEAARAGQHGKGFAVVAEEVRNLASKSAEAAKDTGNMIQNSMDKAQLGSRIAGNTAESLKEIVSGINESSILIAEIAIASVEQSTGIEQINIGIDQVAQVVQQNSATAEESAAASEEMSGQSDILKHLIAQFKLKDDDAAPLNIPITEKPAKEEIAGEKEIFGYSANNNPGSFGKY